MKDFLATFIVCMISCYIFLFFGGALILENIWIIPIFAALFLAILIKAFIHQETKLEELEERIKSMESRGGPEE